MAKKSGPRTVIITGGTKGIGLGIAQSFYNAGCFVLLGARHDNGAAKKLGRRAAFVQMDVTREADHVAAVDAALKKTGRLDAYVNCAGFSGWRAIGNVTEDFLSNMISTNLAGAFWGCKAAAAKLSKDGVIINVASLAGKRGSANNSVYCASKFGVVGLTQSLAKELGPRGIRVNAVCPVYVMTEGVLEALDATESPAGDKNIKSYLKEFTDSQTALKRLPTADDVGGLCVFLASDRSRAITGQSINIDCGVLPQ